MPALVFLFGTREAAGLSAIRSELSHHHQGQPNKAIKVEATWFHWLSLTEKAQITGAKLRTMKLLLPELNMHCSGLLKLELFDPYHSISLLALHSGYVSTPSYHFQRMPRSNSSSWIDIRESWDPMTAMCMLPIAIHQSNNSLSKIQFWWVLPSQAHALLTPYITTAW